jgi:phosphonate transport system permease protein
MSIDSTVRLPGVLRRANPDVREALLRPVGVMRVSTMLLLLVVLGIYTVGLRSTEAEPQEFIEGIPNIVNFIARCLPPQFEMSQLAIGPWSIPVPLVLGAIIQTMFIALIGTTGALFFALPFGLLAARNTSPHPAIYAGVRLFLNAFRSVPELFWALIYISAVGLGPFAGVLALISSSIGALGRIYGDSIETIDPQQVMAVRATGASRLDVFRYGVLPQALPTVASFALLVFEGNIRAATVLGYVGGGGVGFQIQKYFALFQYQNLMGALLLVVATVLIIDRISDHIRRRLV